MRECGRRTQAGDVILDRCPGTQNPWQPSAGFSEQETTAHEAFSSGPASQTPAFVKVALAHPYAAPHAVHAAWLELGPTGVSFTQIEQLSSKELCSLSSPQPTRLVPRQAAISTARPPGHENNSRCSMVGRSLCSAALSKKMSRSAVQGCLEHQATAALQHLAGDPRSVVACQEHNGFGDILGPA